MKPCCIREAKIRDVSWLWVHALVCSSAPLNREVLSLDSKPGIFTLMGFIWYSDEFQQFLQDIKRCKVCKSIQFWAECHHRCCASPWVMVMLVGGWLPQSRVGWLKSWRTIHFNPEHMKRYAWSATVRADLENYSQKGQKVYCLCIWGHWMEACPRNKLIWGSKVQHLTRTFPAITVPTSSDFQSWSIRAVLFMPGWPDQHLSSQLSSVRWVLQVFDCTSRPDKTRRGMAGMVSATARMGRCCWADEPCG